MERQQRHHMSDQVQDVNMLQLVELKDFVGDYKGGYQGDTACEGQMNRAEHQLARFEEKDHGPAKEYKRSTLPQQHAQE